MVTCKYCGSKLDFVATYKYITYFHCDFCDMNFKEEDVCEDKKRKIAVPKYYDDNYYKTTSELLKSNTIELFHMLKDCRSDWYSIFTLLKKLKMNNEDPKLKTTESVKTYNSLYKEYEYLTKQKFVIENIILEKAGYLPEKITDEFLGELVVQGQKSSEKPMYIYINTKVKKVGNKVEELERAN